MPEPHIGGESVENRLKRLRMRSIRRGIREMDMILGRFSEIALSDLSDDELRLYDDLLSENDHDLYQWVTGQAAAPDRFTALIDRIARIATPAG